MQRVQLPGQPTLGGPDSRRIDGSGTLLKFDTKKSVQSALNGGRIFR